MNGTDLREQGRRAFDRGEWLESYEQLNAAAAVGDVPERLRQRMGDDWTAFVAYNLGLPRSEQTKAAGQLFRRAGTPEELERITVPVSLIWGRHDRALRLRIAERASAQYGWPLHVIEDAADDPARDQPEAFLRALRSALPDT